MDFLIHCNSYFSNGMQHNHHSDSPLSSESSMIIEGMSRACRYSPKEKVRIEAYRSKRNQRNFNKKNKNQYACRKTLADTRPYIRGRFVRNDEINKNTTIQWSQIGAGEEEDEDENWITMLDSIVAANFALDEN